MAGITESEVWSDEVYRLEETDFVEGGENGVDNLPHKHLGGRTKFLRRQLGVGLRDAVLQTDAGDPCHMVYVPRFRVPAGLIGAWPAQALELGGFFVDKYPCSYTAATPAARGIGADPSVDGEVAVSRPGVVAWTNVQRVHAAKACTNRVVYGVAAHMLTMREWAAIVVLGRVLGLDLKGNTANGRDSRDPDAFEYKGVHDPTHVGDRVLPGTGPVSWSHNQQAAGIFDLLGNLWHIVDFPIGLTGHRAVYRHRMASAIDDADGISDVDTAITLDGVQELVHWPAANGLVYISAEGANTAEYVRYGVLTDNLDGTITLSDCTRGQEGTLASAHANNAVVECLVDRCIMPRGATFEATGGTLNNVTDPVTFTRADWILYGPGGGALAEGDIIAAGAELLLVEEVNGLNIQASRGYGGTTPAAHGDISLVRVDPEGNPTVDGSEILVSGYIAALSTDALLQGFALPAALTQDANLSVFGGGAPQDVFRLRTSASQQIVARGAACGVSGRYGFGLDATVAYNGVGAGGNLHGFRAAVSL